MNRLILIALAFVLLLLGSVTIMAQTTEKQAVLETRTKKLEDGLKIKEQDWEIKRKLIDPDQKWYAWGLKSDSQTTSGTQVLITLYEFDTPVEAYEKMHTFRTEVGSGVWTKDYGDETEIWDNAGPHGETAIHFRIGSEVVFISGPTPNLTKRFAQHILETLTNQ